MKKIIAWTVAACLAAAVGITVIVFALAGSASDFANGVFKSLVNPCSPAVGDVVPAAQPDSHLNKGPLYKQYQAQFASYQDPQKVMSDQDSIVAAINSIGIAKGISVRGREIAVATAFQESDMQNPKGGDAHSVGVFQAQPTILNADGTPYWGTKEQEQDVNYATNRFYDEMQNVVSKSGIETLPMIQVAMMIQHPRPSAYYSRWAWDDLAKEVITQDLAGPDTGGASITLASAEPVQTMTPINLADCPDIPKNLISVINALRDQVGKPYVWSKDEIGGFDNSGLIAWAYQQVKVSLPLGAHNQFSAGTKVDKSRVILGDIVYYAKNPSDENSIYHAAVWLGNGKVFEASGPGQPVKIGYIDWSHFYGVTRPIPETKNADTASVIKAGSSVNSENYPYKASVIDSPTPLSYLARECTDFAAWHLNMQAGVNGPPYKFTGLGNAVTWKDRLAAQHYRVDDTPEVGALVWWWPNAGDPTIMHSFDNGHVAILLAKYSDGAILVEQYNSERNSVTHEGAYAYSQIVLPKSYLSAVKFIHVADYAGPSTHA